MQLGLKLKSFRALYILKWIALKDRQNIKPKHSRQHQAKYNTVRHNKPQSQTKYMHQHYTITTIYNKSAQSNLERGPCRCKSVPGGGLMTMEKVVAGEFITLHQLLSTLWAKPVHIAKARRSPVQKMDVVASVAA